MDIIWDENKNALLKRERGVCFEDVLGIIQDKRELAVLENPVRDGQVYYLVNLNDYVHVVPAVINDEEQIVLKTIFPSRKFNRIYGGK
jgi:uncharacterized DUF497 family protein